MPYYIPASEPYTFKTELPYEDYHIEGFIVHVDATTGQITGMTDLLHDGPAPPSGGVWEVDVFQMDVPDEP